MLALAFCLFSSLRLSLSSHLNAIVLFAKVFFRVSALFSFYLSLSLFLCLGCRTRSSSRGEALVQQRQRDHRSSEEDGPANGSPVSVGTR